MSDELEGIHTLKDIGILPYNILSHRVISFLKDEGLEFHSWHLSHSIGRQTTCYFRSIPVANSAEMIRVYVNEYGIGIDRDNIIYGKNISNHFIDYEKVGGFVNAYNDMLEHVNELRLQK